MQDQGKGELQAFILSTLHDGKSVTVAVSDEIRHCMKPVIQGYFEKHMPMVYENSAVLGHGLQGGRLSTLLHCSQPGRYLINLERHARIARTARTEAPGLGRQSRFPHRRRIDRDDYHPQHDAHLAARAFEDDGQGLDQGHLPSEAGQIPLPQQSPRGEKREGNSAVVA